MDLPAAILDIIFPPKCAFCGALLGDEEKEVCARCAKALPYRGPGETVRSVDGFDCAVTFYYAGPVVDGVHALKFQQARTGGGVRPPPGPDGGGGAGRAV